MPLFTHLLAGSAPQIFPTVSINTGLISPSLLENIIQSVGGGAWDGSFGVPVGSPGGFPQGVPNPRPGTSFPEILPQSGTYDAPQSPSNLPNRADPVVEEGTSDAMEQVIQAAQEAVLAAIPPWTRDRPQVIWERPDWGIEKGTNVPIPVYAPDDTVPRETTDTGDEMAIDWGNVISGAVDLIQGQTAGGFVPNSPSWQNGSGAAPPARVTVDTRTGAVTPCRHRRRRRLLTSSDLADLASLKAIVGGGAAMNAAVVKAVRR